MMPIFSNSLKDIIEVLMEDISMYGSRFSDCLEILETDLERYVKVNMVLNWEKCHFMVNKGIVLRHLVSERGIEVDKVNIEVI